MISLSTRRDVMWWDVLTDCLSHVMSVLLTNERIYVDICLCATTIHVDTDMGCKQGLLTWTFPVNTKYVYSFQTIHNFSIWLVGRRLNIAISCDFQQVGTVNYCQFILIWSVFSNSHLSVQEISQQFFRFIYMSVWVPWRSSGMFRNQYVQLTPTHSKALFLHVSWLQECSNWHRTAFFVFCWRLYFLGIYSSGHGSQRALIRRPNNIVYQAHST